MFIFLEMLMQITAEARALDFSLNAQKIHDILTKWPIQNAVLRQWQRVQAIWPDERFAITA